MSVKIINADALAGLAQLSDESVHCVVTSPLIVAYCARICVRQVGTQALDVLASAFGGSVRPAKTYAKRGKPMWTWEIRDALAEKALTALLSHLRIKRKQAENCLELRALIAQSKTARVAYGRGHAGASMRPIAISEHMERLKLRANELNLVGEL